MDKVVYQKDCKHIRLKIVEQRFLYRANISIKKQYGLEKERRYYEINYDLFSVYDYSNKEEALKKAKEWLSEQINVLKSEIEEMIGGSNE